MFRFLSNTSRIYSKNVLQVMSFSLITINNQKVCGFKTPSSLGEVFFCIKSFQLISSKRYLFFPVFAFLVVISYFKTPVKIKKLGISLGIKAFTDQHESTAVTSVLNRSSCTIDETPYFISYSSVPGRNRLFINYKPFSSPAMFAKVIYDDHLAISNECTAFEFLKYHHISPYNNNHPQFYFEKDFSFSIDLDYLSDGYKTMSPFQADIKLINALENLPSTQIKLTELKTLDWYSRLPSNIKRYLELHLSNIPLMVKPCHGDLTSRNIFIKKNRTVLIDWECFSALAPWHVDRVGLILYKHFSLLTFNPGLAQNIFGDLSQDVDTLLALIYLSYITKSPLARKILATNSRSLY